MPQASEHNTPANPARGQCAYCEDALTPTRPWQRFCSGRCRDRYHADERRHALVTHRARPRSTLIVDGLAAALDEEMNRVF